MSSADHSDGTTINIPQIENSNTGIDIIPVTSSNEVTSKSKNNFQTYKKRHVYQTVSLNSNNHINSHQSSLSNGKTIGFNLNNYNSLQKPPLPPKPKVIRNKYKRHIYYTIDCSPSKYPVLRDDEKEVLQEISKPNEQDVVALQYAFPPPPVPPRIVNVEAIEQRKKLDTEYFENLKRTVGDELLDLAEENDLPISRRYSKTNGHASNNGVFDRNGGNNPGPYNQRSRMPTSRSFNMFETGIYKKHTTGNILVNNILVLKKCGWYWGNLTWAEAEDLLALSNSPGAFLLRDSQDPKHLLTVTTRSTINTIHHIRLEITGGKFQLYDPSGNVNSSAEECVRHANIVKFIDLAIRHSQLGNFVYFVKPKNMGEPPIQIRLLSPISRFATMKSLKYYCRIAIRNKVQPCNVEKLPLPNHLLQYLHEPQYYDSKECLI